MSGKNDSSEPKGDAVEGSVIAKRAQDVILPEIVEALRQEGAHVDVNVLLVQLMNKTENPDDIVENSEKMLAVAQKYEERRVENFKRMADAIIDVKNRDPDELEKRRNNRMRRCLKGIVGGCSVLGLGGGIVGIFVGGNVVVIGALLTAGCIALAMAGPLATGESMSSNDVVRIVSAMRMMLPGQSKSEEPEQHGPKPARPRKRTRQ